MDASRANVKFGGRFAPAAVGSFPSDVGPYGHLDLGGNVTEWTADRRGKGFAVMRGGNWEETNEANLLDFGAIESPRPATANMFTFGFRCAWDTGMP